MYLILSEVKTDEVFLDTTPLLLETESGPISNLMRSRPVKLRILNIPCLRPNLI
jgi:hypothetical protein